MKKDTKFGCKVEFLSVNHIEYIKKFIRENYPNYIVERGELSYKVKSPILTINNLETLKGVLLIIKTCTSFTNEDMGAHIHYDHTIIDDKNIINLLKFWYCFEDIIYQFSYGELDHLRENGYMSAKKLDEELKEKIEFYENTNKDITLFSCFDNDYGLNLNNHLYNSKYSSNTYEIRVPNGTLNYEIWKNNIEFFANLFQYVNNNNMDYLYKQGKVSNNYDNALELQKILYKNNDNNFMKQYNGAYRK